MNLGAHAYPTRPPAAPRQRDASRSLSSRLSRADSRSPAGTPSPWSIMALPEMARTPASTHASITASCSRTVPMSSTVVVPPSMASASPSSALAPRDAASWAASSGQMRSRSH